jgi:hypothetical protein
MARSTVKPLPGPARPQRFLTHEEALEEVRRQNQQNRRKPVGTVIWTDAFAHAVEEGKSCGCHWLVQEDGWLRVHCTAHDRPRTMAEIQEIGNRLWPGARMRPRPAQDAEGELVPGFLCCGGSVIELRMVRKDRLPVLRAQLQRVPPDRDPAPLGVVDQQV